MARVKNEPTITWQVGGGIVHEIPEGALVTFETDDEILSVRYVEVNGVKKAKVNKTNQAR